MNEPKMTALQWTDLPHIDQVEEISTEDRTCLVEIRDVLAKHQRLQRFGVTLLHHHFPLEENEILVEYCDARNRTLTVRTMHERQIDEQNLIETVWRFDSIEGTKCKRYCPKDDKGKHVGWPNHNGAADDP